MSVTAQTAAAWYYRQGAPRYVADAFGDYHAEQHAGPSLSAAVTRFNGDPHASTWLHWHGRCKGKHLTEMCDTCRTYAQFGEML